MFKSARPTLIIVIPFSFTLLVVWFAWSAFQAAPQLAAENLRGAGLSISAAVEQLAAVDGTFRSLSRYSTPDIAYFALVDRQGRISFHTNPGLVGQAVPDEYRQSFSDSVSEQRQLLGTGEEVYLLRTKIHPDHDEYQLVLALHTYRADQVIRRARTGVTIVAALTVALWGVTVLLFFMHRREERHTREMQRREELARLGEMGAVMAHEIRNPLAGIKGFAQLVESTGDIEQAHYYAARIVTQSLRMEALVTDLLAFARDDHGRRQPVDLSRVIEDCAALLLREAAAQKVCIEADAASQLTAHAVPDRITQLLLNLMKNAIQAMPDGGTVKIKLCQLNDTARISISDTGTGIPAEHIPHIFEPFWTSKTTGTGLGLALCRKIAEEHDGSLTVDSCSGSGAVFTVVLPLNR